MPQIIPLSPGSADGGLAVDMSPLRIEVAPGTAQTDDANRRTGPEQ